MKPPKSRVRDGLKILNQRYYAGRPDRVRELDEERAKVAIARELHALRQEAGLTQAELGKMIGTDKSVICRLESADYDGHSLTMLRRICQALSYELEVRFVPTQSGKRMHIARLATTGG